MECREYERLFEKYFDRDITILEYKAVRSHLSRCAQCREVFFNHLFTLDLLDQMPTDEPNDLLSERVMRNIPKTKAATDWRRWSVGIAACVVLALALSIVEQTIDKDNGGIRTAVVAANIKDQMNSGRDQVILPNNTVLKGNLRVDGDVVVLGKVNGRLQANRVIVVHSEDTDPFYMLKEKAKKFLRLNREKANP